MLSSSSVAAAGLLLLAASVAGAQSLSVASPDGRRTLTAVERTTPIVIDGVLDDEAWRRNAVVAQLGRAGGRRDHRAAEFGEVPDVYREEVAVVGGVGQRVPNYQSSSVLTCDRHRFFLFGIDQLWSY